jgi:purine nucleoside phosphorylase
MAGRGHWIFDRPFAEPLRAALLGAAREVGHPVRDGGCYGHVDGPRFNTRTEIRMLANAGVTAVSQTAGPETVLAGEAEIPYALLGYTTDFANGVKPDEPTPVEELVRLVGESTGTFARVLTGAVPRIAQADLEPVGTHFRFD